jgi:hypothetical protein
VDEDLAENDLVLSGRHLPTSIPARSLSDEVDDMHAASWTASPTVTLEEAVDHIRTIVALAGAGRADHL